MLLARENVYTVYITVARFQQVRLQCQTRSFLALNAFVSITKHVPLQHKTRSSPAKTALASSDKCVSLFLATNNTFVRVAYLGLSFGSSLRSRKPKLNLYVKMIVFRCCIVINTHNQLS